MVISLRFAFGFLAAVALSGCGTRAMSPQAVFLAPTLALVDTDVGNGKKISLSVVDERDSSIIGHRAWALGDVAEITTQQDVAPVIDKKIRQGLIRQNFDPVRPDQATPASLKVEVRLIEYKVTQGFQWALHTRATLKAIARNGDDIFEKFYRVKNEKRVMIVPPDETNSKIINATVSEAINGLLNDRDLMLFLLGP